MTTFTAARTNLSETVVFTPSDNSVQYDPGYGDPLIAVTRVIVVYTMYADNECSSSVEVHGRRRLKSGDLSTVDKVYTHRAWENWRECNLYRPPPAEWLIRLVEDNRPDWWTTSD